MNHIDAWIEREPFDCWADCNVPGRCNPKHTECRLSDSERGEIEFDLDDAVYHKSVDREIEEREG